MMDTKNDALAFVERTRSELAERKEANRLNTLGAYRRLFATPDGVQVLDDLRRRFVDVPIARPGISPDHAFFREGRRSAVATIFQFAQGEDDRGSNTGITGNTAGLGIEGE